MSDQQLKNNETRVYRCLSWDEFISEVRKMRFAGTRLFRGHEQVGWTLSSVQERLLDRKRNHRKDRNVRELFAPGAFEQIRDVYLKRFQFASIGLPAIDSNGWDEIDWWIVGRHFGLVTPLLDWTLSPYVAAFFAYWDRLEKTKPGTKSGVPETIDPSRDDNPICVWELVDCGNLVVKDEFEFIGQRVAYAQRQRAQQGLFTQLSHSTHLDLESYLKSRGLATYLARYEIPSAEMFKALQDLDLMNIKFVTLFPDLLGASIQANIWETMSQIRLRGGDHHH